MKVTDVTLNIFADPMAWNEKKLRIKANDPAHSHKNKLLENYELKAKQIIFDHEIHNKPLTIPEFIRLFKDTGYGNECFFAYAEKVLLEKKNDHAPGTQKGMRANLKKLQQYRSSLTLAQVDLDVIQGFDRYLKHKRKNNDNTVRRAMKTIRTICLHAFHRGLITKNPFVNYKIGEIEGNRDILTEDELKKLMKLYEGNTLSRGKQNALRYFLFSCFTGISHVDLWKLQKRNIIIKEINGKKEKFISYIRQKTKKSGMIANIPLLSEAEALIPKMPYYNEKTKNHTLFHVLTGQATNRHLREIMKIAGIEKTISSHCGRHSFATLCRAKGISADVTSKFMGQKDTKTTMRYIRHGDHLLFTEMAKWNDSK